MKRIGIRVFIVIIFLTCLYLNFVQKKANPEETLRQNILKDMNQSQIKNDSGKEWNNRSIEHEDKENPDRNVSLCELGKILESNLLEDITFQESEKAILYYGLRMREIFDGFVILIYKETVEKNIVFLGQLGIEKETGNIYLLKDEKYVLIKTDTLKEFALPDIPQDKYWEAGSDDEDYKLSEEVYTAVFYCLKESGIENIKIMDMGIYTFLGKRYYWLKLFEENDVQIFTLQHYCIDMDNGNLYEVRDEMGSTYMSLYYMGNVYND